MNIDSLKEQICGYAIEELENNPLIFLSKFGEMINKAFCDEQSLKDIKLKSVLSECPNIEILIDEEKQARIAFCKKNNINAKNTFFERGKLFESDKFHNITKSILSAFTQSIGNGIHIFIEKNHPFKFKRISDPEKHKLDNYIEIEECLLVQNNGCFNSLSDSNKNTLIKNIEQWCVDNSINFDELMAINKKNKREHYIQNMENINILVNFIKVQPDVVKNSMVFPANVILRILNIK